MKSETLLDSVVFQLTPTRTRCDLVIAANGNMVKIASGLLEPFLAHLKTARDQSAKGGYSITLKPDPKSDVTWFTKGTVERFVRFVSTPEVLERVDTIESEILQIDEAIAIQSIENLELSTVEDHQSKCSENIEGSKPVFDAASEKAIVLFKPGQQPPESNGSTTMEENSKVKLLRVLETRKTVLQKEQGMAFARAVAAGFDMEHLAYLLSFAEHFGASRMMEACIKFMELWKRKHETGQWLEIEATEAMSSRSDFSPVNTSGIVFSGEGKHTEFREAWSESHGDLDVHSNGNAINDATGNMGSQHFNSDYNSDKRSPVDSQVPLGPYEYFQGQFHHPMYPQWPMHSAYPMQGMPYYQNYQANGPFFQPPYPPMEDPRFNVAHRMGQKRHSMDSKDSNVESETWEMGVSNGRSQDSTDQSTSEKEVVQGRESRRKVGRSGKTKSGMVVIRNINYITSKRHDTSGSESKSGSGESDDEPESQSDAPERKQKNSVRSSKGKGSKTESTDAWNSNNRDDMVYGQEAISGNWQAFQNFLLRDDDKKNVDDREMFSAEKEASVKRRQSTIGSDPIIHQQDSSEVPYKWNSEFDMVSGKESGTYKQRASSDELVTSSEGLHSHGGRVLRESQLDVQFAEIESGRGYKRGTTDDFMLYGQGNKPVINSCSDPLAGNEFEHSGNFDKSSSQNATDESYIIPFRSSSEDQIGSDSRAAIDIDLEFPSALQKSEDASNRVKNQVNYEPDDLSLMPERGTERESTGYDPAVDYELEINNESAIVPNRGTQDVSTGSEEGLKKSEKEKKSKVQDTSEKRKVESAIRKGKPLKSNPLAEAQARAERLRMFKADLQKMKREKEEEEVKRLEALKRERQKRIAAKSNSSTAQSPSPSQPIKSRLPTKLSPGSHKRSKFSDSEPGSSSHIQRFPTKVASAGSNDSQKATKLSRINTTHLPGNGLSRSVSSLPELKKEDTGPEPKAIPIQTRRLSEPKGINGHRAALKSGGSNPLIKPTSHVEPEIKKNSAITSLDRTKSATLPELKIKTSRSNSNIIQNKSAAEIKQKGNGNRSLTSESVRQKKSNEKTLHLISGDDNPAIEKTVVMLEHDSCAVPFMQTSGEHPEDQKGVNDDGSELDAEGVAENAAIHAPASTNIISEVEKNPNEFQFDVHPSLKEVTTGHASDEFPMSPGISVKEKPYQAPFARASSLEDPSTSNLECSKAPPISSEMEMVMETVKLHISDSADFNSPELVPSSSEKPRVKDSSKGFRRLLKFGRKNHSSAAGDNSMDTDKFSIDSSVIEDHDGPNNSNEVHILKNLISQDDSTVGSTSQKVSRHFSLLSPFRSKNSEKKLAT